jgi:hypothetical protein
MLVTPFESVTLTKLGQLANAPLAMLVTLLGIVTLVRLVQPRNAFVPMLVTGRPLSVAGIGTLPHDPE